MNLRLLATVVGLALTTVAAHAQTDAQTGSLNGIYITPIAIRVSNSTPDTGPFAFLGPNATSQMFYGISVGGYHDFYHQGKISAGFDVRDTLVHGNSASLNSFLVGARVSGSPFQRPIKPYIELSVGAGNTRSATNPVHITKLQYGVFAGADYTLNRHFDLRAIEVGYGSLTTVSSATVGSTATIPAATLVSITTGIVLRF